MVEPGTAENQRSQSVLPSERGKDRKSRRGKALHDVAGANGVLGQGVVVADEAAQVGGAAAEDLCGNVAEIVVRVGGEVVNVTGIGSDDNIGIELTGRVIPLVPAKAINGGVEELHEAEHVIERAVFKHQDDEMLDRGRHGGVPQLNSAGGEADGTLIQKLRLPQIFDGEPVVSSGAISLTSQDL